jgi:hypothetical protein
MSRGAGRGWKCQKKQKNAQGDKATSLVAPYFNSLNTILEPLLWPLLPVPLKIEYLIRVLN